MGIHTSFAVQGVLNRKSQIGIQFTGDVFGKDSIMPIITDDVMISYWMYSISDVQDYYEGKRTIIPNHIFAQPHGIEMDESMFNALLNQANLFRDSTEEYEHRQSGSPGKHKYLAYSQTIPSSATSFSSMPQYAILFMIPDEEIQAKNIKLEESINWAKRIDGFLLVGSMVLLFILTLTLTKCFDKKLTVPINSLTKYSDKLRQAFDK